VVKKVEISAGLGGMEDSLVTNSAFPLAMGADVNKRSGRGNIL
jgi:hypothetical protein